MLPSEYILLYDTNPLRDPPGRDCDCACALAVPGPLLADLDSQTLIERHPQLRALELGEGYSVVFVPSFSRVAVANEHVLNLLERLGTPQALGELAAEALDTARQLYELGLLRPAGAADLPPPPPDELYAWIHVTNACNLRCTYCYVEKTDEAMSAETGFAAIDAIFRSALAQGYRKVVLKYAGGEASLNLGLVEELHAYALDRAQREGLALEGVTLSNGVGLTRHKLQRIRALGLRLMISLDGPEAFHDAQRPTIHGQRTYQATIASVERARELGLDLQLSITVTGASIAGLPEVVSWALERGVRFSINFYRENDCSASFTDLQLDEQRLIAGMRATYRAIEARLPSYSLLGCLLDRTNLQGGHQRTCAVGENYLVVDHHGGIAKCQMELSRPVTDVWQPNPLLAIRLDARGVQNLPVDQKEGCRDCQWRYWCAGGCPVATFRATGRYDIRSPNCGIYQALYPDVLRLEGKRLMHDAGYWQPHLVEATSA